METSLTYQPEDGLNVPNVTILNVLTATPDDLANFVALRLLNVRIPVPGVNHTMNFGADIVPLLPIIANRLAFATELYVKCAAAKPAWQKAKRDPATKAQAEDALAVITSHIDILYRAIQTLTEQREAAGRLITGSNNVDRMYRPG